jgi:hypothetical protein
MNLVVNFDQNSASLPSGFVSAVDYVVNLFDSLFTTNVTATIDVGFGEINGQRLSPGDLGESEQRSIVPVNYSTAITPLIAENAPGSSTLPPSPPPGAPNTLFLPTGEEKALGLIPNNNNLDGWVGFSSFPNTFSYAINSAPPANEYYFVGVVEHEFSEVLGRTSYLDMRQAYSLMDLYRFSGPGTNQFTTGSPSYFSIDNGSTNLNNFNNFQTGDFGDLGDWAPSAGNDAFDDFANPGVINSLSEADLTVMAALGWGSSIASPAGPLQLIGSGDFFGNNTSDVAWQQGGQAQLWVDTGTQLTSEVIPDAAMGSEWTAFGLADFNGNGLSDLLWTNGTGGQVNIWEMAGSNLIASAIPAGAMGTEWQVAATGDFNGDGAADILWHATSGSDDGQVAVWTMQGFTLVNFGISNGALGSDWNVVATGDFYGTGRDAVLWEDQNTGQISDWQLNGPNLQALTPVGQIGGEWRTAGVGHFAGIGNANDPTGDIVWVDNNNDVQIWAMSGGQLAQIVTPAGHDGTEWMLQGVGDFTGSGFSELLWLDNNGDAQIWHINGVQVSVTSLSAPSGTPFVSGTSSVMTAGATNGAIDTQLVSAGQTATDPVITNGTLQLAVGAAVDGPVTFAPGSTGTLYDADVGNLPDTVVGFNEGTDHLSFFGENPATEASVIASAITSNGSTTLTFPDQTTIVLAGITHVDTGIFA